MNSDIRIHIEFWSHAKTRQMIDDIGLQGPVSLQMLWCYVAKHRPDGVLTGMDTRSIEYAAGWPKDRAGEFFAYCTKNGWLDRTTRRGTWQIHEWTNYNPWAANFDSRKEKGKWNAHKLHHVAKNLINPTCDYCRGAKGDPSKPHGVPMGDPVGYPCPSAPSPSPSPSPNVKNPPNPPAGGTKQRRRRVTKIDAELMTGGDDLAEHPDAQRIRNWRWAADEVRTYQLNTRERFEKRIKPDVMTWDDFRLLDAEFNPQRETA